MNIPAENQLKAVIFDMDGVIIDTCELHKRAWQQAGQYYDYTWPNEINFRKDVFGTVSEDSARLLFGAHINGNTELIKRKDEAYETLLTRHIHEITVPGVVDYINFLKSSGLMLALATSARKQEANFVIDAIGIKHLFDVIVDISQVTHAKPHPEIYLRALTRLNLQASECLAFEDSLSGIIAVRSAGLRCVIVKTTMDEEKIIRHGMSQEASINNFQLEEINKLSIALDFIPTTIS